MSAAVALYAAGGWALFLCALVLLAWWTDRGMSAAVPPVGRFVDLPGTRLHVVDQGSGPAILMVHGLGGQLRHFTYGLVPLLATGVTQ